MKYGLTASILCRFASNAVLFSTSKQQNFDWADVARIAMLAVTARQLRADGSEPLRSRSVVLAHTGIRPGGLGLLGLCAG
jgi:hypothetical protein